MFNFFADVAGFLPERLQHELTWERVANLTGKTGMNQPLDLVNEILNAEFKGELGKCALIDCGHLLANND